jgi:succinyl-CoA synthetase beta subunit
MRIPPDQARAIVERCGLRAAPAGVPGEHMLGLRIEPGAGAIRIEARRASSGEAGGGRQSPAAVVDVDLLGGISESDARELLAAAGQPAFLPSTQPILVALLDAFRHYEMLTLEIGLTGGDAGVRFTTVRAFCDENAAIRNERVAELLTVAQPEPTRRLKALGVDYVELDGPVGLLSVGAGETMAAMDLLDAAGCPAACFLDLSGGFGVEAITAAFRQVGGLPRVRAVLVNVFGGLTRVDRVAESMVAALDALQGIPSPLVIRLEGTEAERGRRLLEARGIRCEPTLRGAIAAAVALANGGVA